MIKCQSELTFWPLEYKVFPPHHHLCQILWHFRRYKRRTSWKCKRLRLGVIITVSSRMKWKVNDILYPKGQRSMWHPKCYSTPQLDVEQMPNMPARHSCYKSTTEETPCQLVLADVFQPSVWKNGRSLALPLSAALSTLYSLAALTFDLLFLIHTLL